MAKIHIVIPDAALRGAVVETVMLAQAGNVIANADPALALADAGIDAIVLDEAAADKKTFKAIGEDTGQKSRRIFLLGEGGDAWRDHPAVESFAKPLRLGHLLARMLLHLRAGSQHGKNGLLLGPWRLETQNRQIVRAADGMAVRLTEKETALLDYLAQSAAPVEREELLAAVWGHDGRIDTHTLETHIYQLRRKLDPEGEGSNLVVNERGAYRLRENG
jgi:DNA-binding response OmpR family regulator